MADERLDDTQHASRVRWHLLPSGWSHLRNGGLPHSIDVTSWTGDFFSGFNSRKQAERDSFILPTLICDLFHDYTVPSQSSWKQILLPTEMVLKTEN